MLRIVYENPDGTVSQFIPAPQARLEGESDMAFVKRLQPTVVPADARQVTIIDEKDLPHADDAEKHRSTRKDWRIKDGKVVVQK